ncbi:MAG: RNA-binding protein [Alphaproteobacteria bacterium]|nr:MAG: RNA-binding protein [Alphaproteobacteria bacterium]
MSGLPLVFASPWVLLALVLLPVIWWLLRLTPPRPRAETFPPLAILARLIRREETPAQSPWWLTLLRLVMATLAILAMAGPVWNPGEAALEGDGPVLIVVDDGWAAAADWERRRDAALAIVADAAEDSRTVILVATTASAPEAATPLNPEQAAARLEGMVARPLKPDHGATARLVVEITRDHAPGSTFFLSDGLEHADSSELGAAFAALGGQRRILLPGTEGLVAMAGIRNDPDALVGTLIRPPGQAARPFDVVTFDIQGLPAARATALFDAGGTAADFRFAEPVELRNQVVRTAVSDAENAGAVQLLDDSFRRRVVGIISGQSADLSQPLLSPLYYISRALSPFSDLREADDANVARAVPALIQQGISAIALADVGNLPEETVEELGKWVEGGGMLIRFAGPRLAAAAQDTLLPVRLRAGDRNLGGALSWETPKPLAPFEAQSPFFGIDPPREVVVRRQVLALQEPDLEAKTWAILEDGTPLVTADRRGAGWLVLFHTSSDASWSNLAISGTFVEMLRRVVDQSRSRGAQATEAATSLPPLRLLDGRGRLGAPGPEARPLVVGKGIEPRASIDNPPGFYGTDDGFIALNLFAAGDTLAALDPASFAPGVAAAGYAGEAAFDFKPWLIGFAVLLFVLDCLAVLWIGGALNLPARGRARAAATLFAGLALALAAPPPAGAQDEAIDFSASLITRLAYVVTGDATVDDISHAGMAGLSQFLASRTALEPGEPAPVNIAEDELAFYALLYWPITAESRLPDPATMARVDAFMKQGGTILFDTRDQLSGPLGGTANSPEAQRLQQILSGLDIPQLEPVPPDHVLTKSFYLLNNFPGRYAGGELWVEALPPTGDGAAPRPARPTDGVSSILITSNDFAGAWAVDDSLRPRLPTVPPDPTQRELSYRAGVNIMMYVLTGNYKADQVHVPALLERLGQ